ncbi:MAG: arylsulfatase [Opitutaceae bacterium]|jgi:arylsulfatase A|nr:arylsulfatase [Opitutaceae bacterium]
MKTIVPSALLPSATVALMTSSVLASSLPVAGGASEATPPSPAKTNVLLILADDMAYGDLACVNGGLTRTPSLDQLALQSMFFNRGYSAAPVCAPARAAMLTGRYPHRTGVTALNKNTGRTRLHPDETTIADLFAATGYATGLIGKWHCGDGPACHPLRRGFREFSGFTEDLFGKLKSYYDYALEIQGEERAFKDRYMTDHLTELAVDFVRRHRDRPFFLHLAYNAPHRPLNAPEKLIQSYKDKGFDNDTATIYAMVEVMDHGIGRLLGELDALGLAGNTIVVFASDNGPDLYTGKRFNAQFRGTKYTVYDGGIHVPLMIRWPGRLTPGRDNTLIHFVDLLPTLAAACEITLPGALDLDGINLLDALCHARRPPERMLFWQWNRGLPLYTHNAAMLDGDWKLVRPFVTSRTITAESTQPPMLFNLRDDPGEQNDLATRNPDRVALMNGSLSEWAGRVERDRVRPAAGARASAAPR